MLSLVDVMNDFQPHPQGRLIGVVQVQVGAKVFALPVQAVKLDRDSGEQRPGGFFRDEAGHLGILVDEGTEGRELERQITAGMEDAVRHISKRFLN